MVPGALLIGLSYSPDHPLTWMDLKVEVRGSLGVAENIAGLGKAEELKFATEILCNKSFNIEVNCAYKY